MRLLKIFLEKQKDNKLINIVTTVIIIAALIFCLVKIIKPGEKHIKEEVEKEELVDEDIVVISSSDKGNEIFDKASMPKMEELVPIDMKGLDKYYSKSQQYSVCFPDGYEAYLSRGYVYLRNEENDAQIIIMTSDVGEYEETQEVWAEKSKYLYKAVGYRNGESIEFASVGAKKKEFLTLGDKRFAKEETKYDYYGDDELIYSAPMISYYGTYNSNYYIDEVANEDTLLKSGLLVMGTAPDEGMAKIQTDIEAMLLTFESYVPKYEEITEWEKYTSPNADRISFCYPKGWKIEKGIDGKICISAPFDSIYSGMKIQLVADVNHCLVDYYTQFSRDYEYFILSDFFTQNVGEEGFKYETEITDTDVNAMIGQKEAIYFEVADAIMPTSEATELTLLRKKTCIVSHRYTFESMNVECMLNFIVTNRNCVLLENEIMESVEVQ